MRIAVLIMSGDQEPSLRNVEALKETIIIWLILMIFLHIVIKIVINQ